MIREDFKPGLEVVLAPRKPVQQKPSRVTVQDSLLHQGDHGGGWHQLAVSDTHTHEEDVFRSD